MSRLFLAVLWGAMLLAPGLSVPAPAQVPADSIRARAERDFHGPDGVGKDGPLSAAGLGLLLLYHRYREAENRDTFTPVQSGMRVSDGRVTVEALARDDAAQLRADLERLGLKEAAAAGRLVSGRLPIEQIPAAARLETLQGLMVPQAQTRSTSSPSPASPADPSRSPVPAPPSDSAENGAPSDETGGAILFLVGSGIVLLLIEEL